MMTYNIISDMLAYFPAWIFLPFDYYYCLAALVQIYEPKVFIFYFPTIFDVLT